MNKDKKPKLLFKMVLHPDEGIEIMATVSNEVSEAMSDIIIMETDEDGCVKDHNAKFCLAEILTKAIEYSALKRPEYIKKVIKYLQWALEKRKQKQDGYDLMKMFNLKDENGPSA